MTRDDTTTKPLISNWTTTSLLVLTTHIEDTSDTESQTAVTYIGILAGIILFILVFSAIGIALSTKLICPRRTRTFPRRATEYLEREQRTRTALDRRQYEQGFPDEMSSGPKSSSSIKYSCAIQMNYSPHATMRSTHMTPPLFAEKLGKSYA